MIMLCRNFIVGLASSFLAEKVSILKSLLCLRSVIWQSGRPIIRHMGSICIGMDQVRQSALLQHSTSTFATSHLTRDSEYKANFRITVHYGPTKWGHISIHFVFKRRCYMRTMDNSELCRFSMVTNRNSSGPKPNLPPDRIINSSVQISLRSTLEVKGELQFKAL